MVFICLNTVIVTDGYNVFSYYLIHCLNVKFKMYSLSFQKLNDDNSYKEYLTKKTIAVKYSS